MDRIQFSEYRIGSYILLLLLLAIFLGVCVDTFADSADIAADIAAVGGQYLRVYWCYIHLV